MKLYREVKASERLPEESGPYYVKLKEICRGVGRAMIFGVHDIYTWLDGPQEPQRELWTETFESWLEPIEITEEEISDLIIESEIEYGVNGGYETIAAMAILSKLKGDEKA